MKSIDVPFLLVIQTCQNKEFFTLRYTFITNYDVNS